MDIEKIRNFIQIAQKGSFSAVAAQNYVSQTAISQQMASLEKEMGLSLFSRSTTGVSLTEDGQRMLPYAMEAVDAYDRMMKQCTADAHQRIRVAYSGYIEKHIISETFSRLRAEKCDMEIIPVQTAFSEAETALMDDAVDVALMIPRPRTQLTVQVLAEYPLRAAISKTSSLSRRSTVEMRDLHNFRVAVYSPARSKVILQWLRVHGFREEQILMATSQEDQMLQIALHHAIGFLPDCPVDRDPGVAFIPVEGLQDKHELTAVYVQATEEIRRFLLSIQLPTFSWDRS